MNARILELIKNPTIIQNQDLDLLNSEINTHPYLQNIRALHLIGTKQFDPENYQKELSVTAAYTTDKKILYQLINKKTEPVSTANTLVTSSSPSILEKAEVQRPSFEEVPILPKTVAKPVFVEGNLNRILFEGEEDFLERESEKIDIESTLESGKIVTQSIIKEENEFPNPIEEKTEFIEKEDSVNFTPETVIKENELKKEEPLIEDSSVISFHGLEEFLPNIKINSKVKEENYAVPKPQLSKQEIEMQLLIAQVEAKMKTSKKDKIQEPEIIENHDINFSETQKLEISPLKKEEEVKNEIEKESPSEVEIQIKAAETLPQIEEKIETEVAKTVWKPMQFSGNTPDSLISKKTDPKPEEVIPVEKSSENKAISEQKDDREKTEERPVFNVSFFTQKVSAMESKKSEIIEEKTEAFSKIDTETAESNIPVFINTWQNWLKIDRKTEIIEEPLISKEEIKNTVIEKFIEKEPKISKLKEESDFVVKEKGSNISHLMTETLANLYVEQKLYAKAIKAYETLTAKHPQKEEIFKEKIQEIKELRKNP
jgi:hypothetical protein